MSFEVGDAVKLGPGCAICGLDAGRVYTVQDTADGGKYVRVAGAGGWWLCEDAFVLATAADLAPEAPAAWLNSLDSAARKEIAIARGLFAYFPDALALIARHSVRSNEKHNPGQPVHWSREKSSDHEDCIARHSLSVAVDPDALDGDAPHIVCRAWRALAALQMWAESKHQKGETL